MVPVVCALTLGSPRADAWPADLSKRIARDALKLLPRSLAEVLVDNEAEIFGEARVAQSTALSLVYLDLPKGQFSAATMTALDREFVERVNALHGAEFRSAVISLGATYRLVVDLSDPGVGLGGGDDVRAKAIRREFYLFVADNQDKIPLVVDNPGSLTIELGALPAFLADAASKTREQTARLRAEGQEEGRILPFSGIGFTSPVFAIASAAYSRSVSAVAATWIAIWHSAGGDMNRPRPPRIINPGPTPLPPGRTNP